MKSLQVIFLNITDTEGEGLGIILTHKILIRGGICMTCMTRLILTGNFSDR